MSLPFELCMAISHHNVSTRTLVHTLINCYPPQLYTGSLLLSLTYFIFDTFHSVNMVSLQTSPSIIALDFVVSMIYLYIVYLAIFFCFRQVLRVDPFVSLAEFWTLIDIKENFIPLYSHSVKIKCNMLGAKTSIDALIFRDKQ